MGFFIFWKEKKRFSTNLSKGVIYAFVIVRCFPLNTREDVKNLHCHEKHYICFHLMLTSSLEPISSPIYFYFIYLGFIFIIVWASFYFSSATFEKLILRIINCNDALARDTILDRFRLWTHFLKVCLLQWSTKKKDKMGKEDKWKIGLKTFI